MISKETFCKALRLIEEQREIDRQFSKALELLGNGYYVFGSTNKHLEAAVIVLKEAMSDKYEYIEWWLFDTGREKTVHLNDGSKTWDLATPEALYDYIINECS